MDKLIINADIHTMNPDVPHANAAVIIGRYFAYVGDEEGARLFVGSRDLLVDEIDINGYSLLPGFNDSHLHFLHYVKTKKTVNLFGVSSLDGILNTLESALESKREDTDIWLVGEGWNQDYFTDDKRFPTAKDLDKISRDVPIIIMRACFHIGVLNSKAMELMGINIEFAKKHRQYVDVDNEGKPNGIVKEYIFDDIKSKLPAPAVEDLVAMLLDSQIDLYEQGITSIQSDDVKYLPRGSYPEFCRLMRAAGEDGRLKLRYSLQLLVDNYEDVEKVLDLGFNRFYGNDIFKISCIKILADGSLGAKTAYLRENYLGDTGRGIAIYSDDQLKSIVAKCHENNFPVAIHAIGDGAIEQSLKAIEYAQNRFPHIKLRHGIVHAQITDKEIIRRFKSLEVGVFAQPIFINYDMHIVYDRVAKSLAETSYAWKSFINAGVVCAYGSDAPVESFNTMPNIFSAVTRKSLSGEGPFLSNEKVSLEESIEAYTVNGAIMSYEEDIKGRIKEGYLADFIILDGLLSNICEEALRNIKVKKTFFGGELVYERQG
ncbi:MAG: amidohydrolase [Tissierellia bacterium]|nr:amidohydrolase [Tissierellia bacterium]